MGHLSASDSFFPCDNREYAGLVAAPRIPEVSVSNDGSDDVDNVGEEAVEQSEAVTGEFTCGNTHCVVT